MIQAHQPSIYPRYERLGQRVLNLLAPNDANVEPFRTDIPAGTIGSFVEQMISSGNVSSVSELDSAKLMSAGGGAILQEALSAQAQARTMHPMQRDGLAKIVGMINFHGYWAAIAESAAALADAEGIFGLHTSLRQEREAAARPSQISLQDFEFPSKMPVSTAATSSMAELQHAAKWLHTSAREVLGQEGSIPQFINSSPLMDEINSELRNLAGRSTSERLAALDSIIRRVEFMARVSEELSEKPGEKVAA